MTNGRVRLGPGTLYGAIKRLLAKGIIKETEERPDPELNDERWRYYQLTYFGLRVLKADAARMAGLVQQAESKRLFPDLSQNPAPEGG